VRLTRERTPFGSNLRVTQPGFEWLSDERLGKTVQPGADATPITGRARLLPASCCAMVTWDARHSTPTTLQILAYWRIHPSLYLSPLSSRGRGWEARQQKIHQNHALPTRGDDLSRVRPGLQVPIRCGRRCSRRPVAGTTSNGQAVNRLRRNPTDGTGYSSGRSKENPSGDLNKS